MKPTTLGVIFSNRDFFPDQLVTEARADIASLFAEFQLEAVMLGEGDTKLGGVETFSEATKCARLFQEREGTSSTRTVVGTRQAVNLDCLPGASDPERHEQVRAFLEIQEKEARWWRDASVLYFQTFSKRPTPEDYEPAARTLEEYMAIDTRFVPGH